MQNRIRQLHHLLLLWPLGAAPLAVAAPVIPDFNAATFIKNAPIDNPYFPMRQGPTNVYVGEFEENGELQTESFEQSNIGPGKTLLGVMTQTQLDRAFEGDLLVEETRDYYAQDTDGNVWYFGEDVVNFNYDDDGNLIGTDADSSWLAGVNGALPGLIMPSALTVGFNYFQEYAIVDDALDHGTIASVGNTVTIDIGTFTNVLQILEGSVLDPEFREFKYYAPGVGLILAEEGLDANLQNPDLSVELVAQVSAPPTLPLLASMVAGLGLIRRLHR